MLTDGAGVGISLPENVHACRARLLRHLSTKSASKADQSPPREGSVPRRRFSPRTHIQRATRPVCRPHCSDLVTFEGGCFYFRMAEFTVTFRQNVQFGRFSAANAKANSGNRATSETSLNNQGAHHDPTDHA